MPADDRDETNPNANPNSSPSPAPTDEALVEQAYDGIRRKGAFREGMKVAREVAGRAADEPALRARALHVLGHAQSRLRAPGKAIATLLEAAGIYEELGDDRARANVYDTLGQTYAARGRLEQALHYYALSLVDKAVLGDRHGIAVTVGNIGRMQLRAGRYREAIRCFERDLALSIELGDVRGRARMYEDLGRAWVGLEEYGRAEAAYATCLRLAREHGLSELSFYAHIDRAVLFLRQDRVDEAAEEFDAACAVGLGEVPYFSMILEAARGWLLYARDDPTAIDVLRRALRRLTQAELVDAEMPVRIRLARALMKRGLKNLAEEILLDGVRRARRLGYARYLAPLNEAMTELAVVEGALDEGARPRRRREEGDDTPADGAYVVLDRLGSGAYGEVYRAFDPRRGIEVALKVVHLERRYDLAARERLVRSVRVELEAASRVRHPGVARVYAIGTEEDGGIYVVEEYVPGPSLRRTMDDEADPPVDRVLDVMDRLAHSLQALDDAGVVHRDLKPENVIVREDGTPVLVDFGLAHVEVAGVPPAETAGTLEYMAPEQARGEVIDGRADLYSLGVIAFEWLVGFRPLQLQERPPEAWGDILDTREPARVTEFRPDVAPEVADLIASLLAKDPDDRPPDAAAVAAACAALR